MSTTEEDKKTEGGGFMKLVLKLIGRSPWNREHFDKSKLDELAADVAVRGIIQPLIVRKNPKYAAKQDGDKNCWAVWSLSAIPTKVKGNLSQTAAEGLAFDFSQAEYELIAGERRWRAGTIAKLPVAPAIVKEATDKEAIEDQAVENLQREDLNPIEEAEKYQQLIEVYRQDGVPAKEAAEMVAKKLNISRSLVYERMTLLNLPDAAKDAALAGRLPASHAALIARLDDRDAQVAVTARILKPTKYELPDADDAPAGRLMEQLTVMSFRRTKALIEESAKAVKNRRAYNAQKAEFERKGHMVLTDAQNKKLFKHDWDRSPEGFVSGDDTNSDAGWIPWKKAMGKHAPAPVLAFTPRGEAVVVYPIKEAEAAVLKNGVKLRSKTSSKRSAEQAEADRQAKARVIAFRELLGKVAGAAERMDGPEIWKFIYLALSRLSISDAMRHVAKRRGIPTKGSVYEAFRGKHKDLNGKELRGMVAELLFATFGPSNYGSAWDSRFPEICKAFDLEPIPWTVKVQTPGTAKEKPKAKEAKKPKPEGTVAPAKSGSLATKILKALTEAGATGLSVKELAAKTGCRRQHIHIWMATTGKGSADIEKRANDGWRIKIDANAPTKAKEKSTVKI